MPSHMDGSLVRDPAFEYKLYKTPISLDETKEYIFIKLTHILGIKSERYQYKISIN